MYFNMLGYQLATHKSLFVQNVGVLLTELTVILGIMRLIVVGESDALYPNSSLLSTLILLIFLFFTNAQTVTTLH